MVTCLGSLVQLCCGEGGTLQTNITGMCGECSQCLDHTGFASAHGMCIFLVYAAQAPGCSAGELSKVGLGCMHFAGLSCSGSGSLVLHKGTDSIRHTFYAFPRSQQLRCPGTWWAHCPWWAVSWVLVPGASWEHHFRCAVCLLWGADLWLWHSWQMSTVQDPRKTWLATGSLLTVWWKMQSLGLRLQQAFSFQLWLGPFLKKEDIFFSLNTGIHFGIKFLWCHHLNNIGFISFVFLTHLESS